MQGDWMSAVQIKQELEDLKAAGIEVTAGQFARLITAKSKRAPMHTLKSLIGAET